MPLSDVPVIDLTAPRAAVVAQLAQAAADPGFFQVVNSGLDAGNDGRYPGQCGGLFCLRSRGEARCLHATLENPFGYYDRELTKNPA